MATKFDDNLAFGKFGEKMVSAWLRNVRGETTLPVKDEAMAAFRGPRIESSDSEIVSPDLLVVKDGDLRWIEVKRKMHFTWFRIDQQWETGIDIGKYEQYLAVRQKLKWPVWLVFLHENETPSQRDIDEGCPCFCPCGLFGCEIEKLRTIESHRSEPQEWAPSGMVFWPHFRLEQLATIEEVQLATQTEEQKMLHRLDGMKMPF